MSSWSTAFQTLSDAFLAQQNHGAHQQTSLAHLARGVAYRLEASDEKSRFRRSPLGCINNQTNLQI
jgi:hypothetical protein